MFAAKSSTTYDFAISAVVFDGSGHHAPPVLRHGENQKKGKEDYLLTTHALVLPENLQTRRIPFILPLLFAGCPCLDFEPWKSD